MSSTGKKRIFNLALAGLALLLSACSGSASQPPETATAQAARIHNMATQMAVAGRSTEAVSHLQQTKTAQQGKDLLAEAASWQLVISDSFDNNANQWTTGVKASDLSTETLSVDGGQYNWVATAKSGFVYWTTQKSDTLKDFYVAVDAQQISGPDDGEMGLVFHEADTSNFYLFEVSSVKMFAVSQFVQDEWQVRIDWTDSDTVQSFQNNHLAVIGKGADFYFFINDSLVGTYTEPTATEGSSGVAVALYHENDTGNFAFDNFELRAP
jgi:hypothetical protein